MASAAEVIKSDEKSASRSKTESDKKMMIIDSAIENCASRSKIESWSDLPIDMLYSILCELPSLCDRIRARAVCKNWLLPLNEICRSSESQLPWLLLSFKWDDDDYDDDTNDIQANLSRCKLLNPLYEEYTSSYYQQLKKISNNRERSFDRMRYGCGGTKVCASKNGWVMFYNLSKRPTLDEFEFVEKTSFFVYNPFTKHTITLPDLITLGLFEFSPSFEIATFSSSPDEDDCVFLVVRRGCFYQGQNFYATYCRRSSSNSIMGQQKWKIDQFNDVYDRIEGSVYMDGIFYCVSNDGTLTSFNATLREWTNLTYLCPIPNNKSYYVFLVELNGELLMLLSDGHLRRELLVGCDDKRLVQMLYVFDKSRKAWVRRENRYLKDRALALCLGTYGSFAFSVEGYHDFIRVTYNKGPMVKRPKITKLWIQPLQNSEIHSFKSQKI